jgi:hypothetical protein
VTVLKQGVAGAALATAVSQYVGAFYLLFVAVEKVRYVQKPTTSTTTPTSSSTPSSSTPSTGTDGTDSTAKDNKDNKNNKNNNIDIDMKGNTHTTHRRGPMETLTAVREKIYIPSVGDMVSYLQFCGPLFAGRCHMSYVVCHMYHNNRHNYTQYTY